MEAIAPQLSHNTKKAFKIAKTMCPGRKRQSSNCSEMLEDYKKKPKHREQKQIIKGMS